MRLLIEQCALFQPVYVYDTRIETLTRATVGEEEVWRLGTTAETHFSRTIVISGGIGAFQPTKIDKPGVAEFEGRGVYYFVKDKRPFRGKRILIVGGGDTAVDWCLNLKDWAKEITLIHRRDQFRAHESSLAALAKTDIKIMTFHEIKRVYGDGEIHGASVYDNRTGVEQDLPVDAVLVNIGFKAALGPIESWGFELADNRHIRTDGFMATNLPNVFAAGDIASVDGSEPLNLIVTGFGQAAIAANAAKRALDPKSRLFPGHSSELKL